jgi:hypothetical protein
MIPRAFLAKHSSRRQAGALRYHSWYGPSGIPCASPADMHQTTTTSHTAGTDFARKNWVERTSTLPSSASGTPIPISLVTISPVACKKAFSALDPVPLVTPTFRWNSCPEYARGWNECPSYPFALGKDLGEAPRFNPVAILHEVIDQRGRDGGYQQRVRGLLVREVVRVVPTSNAVSVLV